MMNQAFVKRVVPFFLTFALGLFIAGFFVSIAPGYKSKNKNRCGKRTERILQVENDQLKSENERLKQRLADTERMILLEAPLPPPPPPAVIEKPVEVAPAHSVDR